MLMLERDLEAIARLVVLLEPRAETTPPAAGGWTDVDPRTAPTPEVLLEPSSAATHTEAESKAEHAPFDQ